MYNPCCPETHTVGQVDLELRDVPDSQMLGLKVCAPPSWIVSVHRTLMLLAQEYLPWVVFKHF